MADDDSTEDELALKRKEVSVDPDATAEQVEEQLRAAFPPAAAYFFNWLESERGTEVAKTITDLIKSAKAITLDRMAEEKKQSHKRQLVNDIGRFVMMGGILVLATVLQLNGKLDTVIVGLLSLGLGFLFGRQTAQH